MQILYLDTITKNPVSLSTHFYAFLKIERSPQIDMIDFANHLCMQFPARLKLSSSLMSHCLLRLRFLKFDIS